MGGFLDRWSSSPPVAPRIADSAKLPEHPGAPAQLNAEKDSAVASAQREEGVPWAEWKAAELTRLFQEQGVAGLPSRISAATIIHGARAAHPQILIDAYLDFGKGITRLMSCAR